MGAAMPGRVFVGFIWCTEFFETTKSPLVTAIVLGFDGLVLTFCSLWFRYISIQWKSLQVVFFLFSIVGFISTKFCFPESPKFVHNEGKHEEARMILGQMATKNKMPSLSLAYTRKEVETIEGHIDLFNPIRRFQEER